jgi:hypothetical protein
MLVTILRRANIINYHPKENQAAAVEQEVEVPHQDQQSQLTQRKASEA